MIQCHDLQGFSINVSDAKHDSLHDSGQFYQLRLITYVIMGSIIIIIGIFGNVLNLIVLSRPSLKGTTYVYLKWLALSDLLALIVAASIVPYMLGRQDRSYGAAFYYAHFAFPLINYFFASSAFLVVVLSVERFVAVCIPSLYDKVHDIRQARLFILGSFLLPLVLYIPFCFQKKPFPYPTEHGKIEYLACDNPNAFEIKSYTIYVFVREIIVRFLPMIIVAILNTYTIIVFRKVQSRKRELLRRMSHQNQHRLKEERKFTKQKRLIILLAGIAILFFIGTLPPALLLFFLSDRRELDYNFQLFRGIANVLVTSNCSLNFYIYCFCSPKVREATLELISSVKVTLFPSMAPQPDNQMAATPTSSTAV